MREIFKRYSIMGACALGSLLAPLAPAAENAVFDFEAAGFPVPSLFNQPHAWKGREGETELRAVERPGGSSTAAVLSESRGMTLSPRSDSALNGELASLTVSLAFRMDKAVPTPVFLQRIQSSSSNPGYFSFHSQNNHGNAEERRGTLRFVITDSQGAHTAASKQNWNGAAGEWHCAAIVFDGGTVRFYLDGAPLGEPVTMQATSIPAVSPDGKAVFRSGFGFPGAVDDLVILPNRVLDDEQIKLLHESGLASGEVLEILKP